MHDGKEQPELLAEAKYKVRLSEDMGDDKVLINPAAIARAMDAMQNFSKILAGYPDARVLAVATEAMRRARNGPALAELLFQTTGIPIRIISGEEEAFFDFQAVRHSLPERDALIIDTGGGLSRRLSTECSVRRRFWNRIYLSQINYNGKV